MTGRRGTPGVRFPQTIGVQYILDGTVPPHVCMTCAVNSWSVAIRRAVPPQKRRGKERKARGCCLGIGV